MVNRGPLDAVTHHMAGQCGDPTSVFHAQVGEIFAHFPASPTFPDSDDLFLLFLSSQRKRF